MFQTTNQIWIKPVMEMRNNQMWGDLTHEVTLGHYRRNHVPRDTIFIGTNHDSPVDFTVFQPFSLDFHGYFSCF